LERGDHGEEREGEGDGGDGEKFRGRAGKLHAGSAARISQRIAGVTNAPVGCNKPE
jgi:hypothetical protein